MALSQTLNSQDLHHPDSIHGPMADQPPWELLSLKLEVFPCISLDTPMKMDIFRGWDWLSDSDAWVETHLTPES